MSKSWVNKFEVVGIIPGKVVLPGYGTLDLSDESLPMDRVQGAYDKGCPYLKLKNVKESEKDSKASPSSEDEQEFKEHIKDVAKTLNEIGSNTNKKKKPSTEKNPS